ncbi:probable N-acetyltransferase HLS1 isoform X2 [Rosa rugosa]|uniref:probable N-acetyltransferase HLS1 isoform X2 n=1 Tax=Rosa rugosa TaxID=74645 RepID=UPI002B405638|nr:probable N-acetyltransferase HLS1 isoform X2 [Rosa rugosa]
MRNNMVDKAVNKFLIREFSADTDIEVVGKLERNCELGSKRGVSIFTNMMCDPLCRIRFYPLHIILVAQLLENEELVGVVRGCIKHVGTGFGGVYVMGCILGLRVSPTHRRMGIGFQLMNSVEEWLLRKGAQYTFLATERNNTASTNLFTSKCNYENISSLIIFVQPICSSAKHLLPQNIKIEKLHVDQAISLYENKLRSKDISPTDMDVILKEKLSLGTWVCYFEEQGWINLDSEGNNKGTITKTQSSWVIFSIWNNCEPYKLHIRKSHPLRYFHATLNHAREKIFSCLKMPQSKVSVQSSLGFLFLYGIHGEGEQLGELMKSVWNFALGLGQNVKDSKLIITELGQCDPLIKHVPDNPSISRIHDLWYAKSLSSHHPDDQDALLMKGPLGNVFVDPREF